ncbi:MAG: hypothetical protein ACR2QK_02525 [Acidimicrobiales bacterium]
MSDDRPVSSPDRADPPTHKQGESPPGPVVVPLNDAAALFGALAEKIAGQAAGWSPTAVDLLESRLEDRYGAQLGDEQAVKRLVALACTPAAA